VHKPVVTSGEKEGRRGKIGVWDEEIQTTMNKINEQQGYNTGKCIYCFVIALKGV